MKLPKPLKNSHTPNTKKGQGDYYGHAIKNPVAKSKEIMGLKPNSPNKIKTPPRSMG